LMINSGYVRRSEIGAERSHLAVIGRRSFC
jgi:hypothetical protein